MQILDTLSDAGLKFCNSIRKQFIIRVIQSFQNLHLQKGNDSYVRCSAGHLPAALQDLRPAEIAVVCQIEVMWLWAFAHAGISQFMLLVKHNQHL